MHLRAGHWWGLLILVLALCFAAAPPVLADANIRVTISDPDHPSTAQNEGNTVATASEAPAVSAGDNRKLGTLNINGKPGIRVPLQTGDRIKVSLSAGVCYMKVPTSANYRKYVSWPGQIGKEENQICDAGGQPGMVFECATPHSMVLRVGNIDSSAKAMLLCLNFDQENYSCVRIAPFVEIADQWAADSKSGVTRLEFFKQFAAIAPSRYIDVVLEQSGPTMEQKFSDLDDVDMVDREIIRPLIDSFLVKGYAGGLLKPGANITRNEAFAVAGRSFGYMAMPGFRDQVAQWGGASINYAARRFMYWGYPDGTFQGNSALTRAEALELLQNCFETKAKAGANSVQGQALGFI